MTILSRWPLTSWTLLAVAPLYAAWAFAHDGPTVVLVPPPVAEPRAFPLPDPHPTCRIVDPVVLDGRTVLCRRLLDGGACLPTTVRLAPTEGTFEAFDQGTRYTAQARLEALLTGGPFWVRLTGERAGDAWVGRVYRQATVEVLTPDGIAFEQRMENVADAMVAEGLGTARGE